LGHHPTSVWLGFSLLVAGLLFLDLGVLNRRAHILTFKEAMSWSLGLIAIALLFGLFVIWREGAQAGLEYYTGYLIELSLSVDNLFVFILILSTISSSSS
jgi:tellurite resistance protein TerC